MKTPRLHALLLASFFIFSLTSLGQDQRWNRLEEIDFGRDGLVRHPHIGFDIDSIIKYLGDDDCVAVRPGMNITPKAGSVQSVFTANVFGYTRLH